MIESKSKPNNDDQFSTTSVTEVYRDCREDGKTWYGTVNNPYGEDYVVGGAFTKQQMTEMLFKDDGDNVWGKMEYMLTPQAYNYFNDPSNFEDAYGNRVTPTGHGVMEDLHRALESNNLTVGWIPQHRIAFYHSTYDTTDNYMNTKFDGTSTGTLTTANEKVGWQEAFDRIYELTTEPQTIGSVEELKAFRDAVNSNTQYKNSANNSVVLTADIDLASETNWTPIGTASHPFDGVFDGGGHTIQNLCVNRADEDCVGLFGYANHVTIYNLYLLNPMVKGKDGVGTLLGYGLRDMRISDVLVTGTSTGDDYYTVTGDLYCGGIVGRAYSKCVIERSVFSGVIKGTVLQCGGILGEAYDDVTVSDCAASHYIQTNGTVDNPMGGIIGFAYKATVNRCLARNTLTQSNSTDMKYGYVIGEVDSNVHDAEPRNNTITNCAYWTSGSGINTVVGAITETDYPIPTTLKDMYMNRMVMWKDDNGLVYPPVGTAANPTAFEVSAYEGEATTLTIPDTYNNKPVTAILPEVFKGNSTLQTLTIGSNVTDIGQSAFEDCDALTQVVLPNAVEYVHARAFRGCDNLTSFTIGSGFAHHDDNFIADCPKLTTLPASPTS